MKNLMKTGLFLLAFIAGNSLLAQNVSTGIDNAGNSIAVGATDPNWVIASGPAGPTAKRCPSYTPYWQVTPIAGTNAGWIDATGNIFGSTPGIYTFERSFTVGNMIANLNTAFGVAWDDILVSLELVPPTGPTIPLTVPAGPMYYVSPMINQSVSNPMPGTWKIRAVVNFYDSVGAFLLSGEIQQCPKINVSTAIDNNGNALAVGATDPNWVIASGPAGPAAKRCPSYTPYWQVTPIAGTNAGWIDATGAIFGSAPGIYTFERSFTIGSSVASFTTNFGVAWDDVLVSLELVPPTGPAIPLTVPAGPMYNVSPMINYTVTAPMAGTWKIRAVVNFIDSVGAFILSGDISTHCGPVDPDPCTCEDLVPQMLLSMGEHCELFMEGSLTGQSDCFSNVTYDWSVNGSYVGSGANFNYPLGAGTWVICLNVTATLPDGTLCEQRICQDLAIKQCGGGIPDKMMDAAAELDQSVVIYPNPASSEVNLEFNLGNESDVLIRLTTMDGKEILRETKAAANGMQRFNLQVPASVADGVIFVEIAAGDATITRKVSISRR